MFISGIYSLNVEIKKTESGLSTGSIDIEIVEYNQNNQPFNEDGKIVMPGDEIILIPKINNLGDECFIRTKIEYIIDNKVFPLENYIEGNYSTWNNIDGYYYYNSKLSRESSIELFNKITIPNLTSEYIGKKVAVHIIVEAIQAKNFDGNWNNVEIKKSIDRTYDIDYDGESNIIYEDNTNHHIIIDNGFFDKLGNMLPGDSVYENVKLLNKSNSKNEYYLSIDYNNLSSKEIELLQNVKLLIKKQNGDVIVDSNLSNKDNHILGTYKKGEGDTFIIEVSIPTSIDNEYSKLFTKINWKFSDKVISKVSDGQENPKTGDFGINLSMTVFILSSIGLLIILLIGKKTENIEKEV